MGMTHLKLGKFVVGTLVLPRSIRVGIITFSTT